VPLSVAAQRRRNAVPADVQQVRAHLRRPRALPVGRGVPWH